MRIYSDVFSEIEYRRHAFQHARTNPKFRELKGGADLDLDEDGQPNPLKVMMLRKEREERTKAKTTKKP